MGIRGSYYFSAADSYCCILGIGCMECYQTSSLEVGLIMSFYEIMSAFDKEKLEIEAAHNKAQFKMDKIGDKYRHGDITHQEYERLLIEIRIERDQEWNNAREKNTLSV